ncbi:MAG: hypothetical protein HZC22_08785 [Rhodocyclales bacterium]|nr:hypothetical protein [Rhodocyclales bacterium]
MKKLFLAGAVLAISVSANAALGVPEFPAAVLPDFLVPSIRGGDHGRRGYDDDHYDRGRHRGHHKKRSYRRDRVADAPVPVVPVPVLPVPHRLPAPPLPPGAPRPPGF